MRRRSSTRPAPTGSARSRDGHAAQRLGRAAVDGRGRRGGVQDGPGVLVEHDERVAELGQAGRQAAHHLVARAPALDHKPSDAPLNRKTAARVASQRAEMVLGHQLRRAQQRDGDDGRRQPAARAEHDRGHRDRRDEEEARRVGRGQQARHLERRDRGEEEPTTASCARGRRGRGGRPRRARGAGPGRGADVRKNGRMASFLVIGGVGALTHTPNRGSRGHGGARPLGARQNPPLPDARGAGDGRTGRQGGDRHRAARGIGRATAELLGEHGAKVVVNDLDGDVADQAAAEIGGRRSSTPAT